MAVHHPHLSYAGIHQRVSQLGCSWLDVVLLDAWSLGRGHRPLFVTVSCSQRALSLTGVDKDQELQKTRPAGKVSQNPGLM